MKKTLVTLGRIVRPHGVRGELVIEPERATGPLEPGETVYVGEQAEPHQVQTMRHHRARWLLRLAGCEDREAAEAFRGMIVQVEREREALPPGQHHAGEVVGLAVFTEAGEPLGEVTEIIVTGANDVYVVTGPGGDVLLPAIPDVIRQVDLEARRMTVHLLEGLR
jgi:16S rRNA processing protein RimM